MSARTRAALAATLWLFGLGACTSEPYYGGDFADAAVSVPDGPLGGEALEQRKSDMRRAYADLVVFHATLLSMIDRGDTRGISEFDDFLATYLGTHLDPLLRGRWQSTHPELASLDASLRFAKAELLIQLRYPRGVQQIIDDLEERYQGQPNLLVDYPLGGQGTLGAGLEYLRDRKWSG